MIQIEQVPFIPKLEYGDYAWKELQMSAGALSAVTAASEGIWVVTVDEPVLVCGIINNCLLNRPRFWFLLCRAFADRKVNYHLRALRQCVKLLSERYPSVETYVEADWETGEKFAKFCGFTKTTRSIEMYGKTFTAWEN